jgi:hypothetical protein
MSEISTAPGLRHHAVTFYGNDDSLFATVAGFLAQGLVLGQPALVIATETHRAGINRQLTDLLVDVDRAAESGDLLLLDADEMLDKFMRDGMPAADLFQVSMGGLVAKMLGQPSRSIMRAYGEMVDVLWQDGQSQAAIELEIMWNQLVTQYGFALLCGYSMGHFYKQGVHYEKVRSQHTDVIGTNDNVVMFQPKQARRKG